MGSKIKLIVSLVLVIVIGFISWLEIPSLLAKTENKASGNINRGIAFSPFRNGQNPDRGVFPSITEIEQDVKQMKPFFQNLRTYGSGSTLKEIVPIAERNNLLVTVGAWLNPYVIVQPEIETVINLAKNHSNVGLIVVGNETILFGQFSEVQIIDYIEETKRNLQDLGISVPISTGEPWNVWLEHPALAEAADFLLIHIHPYWEGVAVENAVGYIETCYQQVKNKYPGKRIVIGEAGWPSEGATVGGATPGLENQKRFIEEFLEWANQKGVEFYLFEAFDEKWKCEQGPGVECHWGMYYSNRTPKPALIPFLSYRVFLLTIIKGFVAGTPVPTVTPTPTPNPLLKPAIEFTYVPPIGSFNDLQGRVLNVDSSQCKVAAYIYVVGNWWTKPYFTSPLTTIRSDGSFTVDITTGGVDEEALRIRAYLVRNGYNPPLAPQQGLPPDPPTNDIWAVVEAIR